MHWQLRGAVEGWVEDEKACPFCYYCDTADFEKGLKHHALLWRYSAVFGALFQMNSAIWSKLPWKEEFSLGAEKIRPRLFVERSGDLSELNVFVRIVPELVYQFHLHPSEAVEIDLEKMKKELKERLKKTKGAVRFLYSAKSRSFDGWLALINPDIREEDVPQDYDQTRAVLIPRHFVMTEPEFSLQKMNELSAALRDEGRGAFEREITVAGGRQHVFCFHAPDLLEGIQRAFVQNRYGDQLYELRLQLTRLSRDLGSADPEIPWKRMAVVQLNSERPSYWWLDPALDRMAGPDRWRWEALQAFQEVGTSNGRDFNFMPPANDTVERGLKELLEDCDADFLLRGLSAEDRMALDYYAEKWTEALALFLAPPDNVDKAIGKDLVIAALEVFCRHDRRRVIRMALETAQRCLLSGGDPIALVVETKDSIRRRWSVYLRERNKAGWLSPVDKSEDPNLDCAAFEAWQRTEDQSIEIRDLCSLVRYLVRKPQDSNFARSFAEEAAEAGEDVWREVLDLIAAGSDGARIKTAVERGLKLCRGKSGDAAPSEEMISELMDLFQNVGPSPKLAVKPRKRPNAGE